jgi:hypothetical protein
MSMGPRFIEGGCCWLDFLLLWAENAIHAKDPDKAYHYSRQLFHPFVEADRARARRDMEAMEPHY